MILITKSGKGYSSADSFHTAYQDFSGTFLLLSISSVVNLNDYRILALTGVIPGHWGKH